MRNRKGEITVFQKRLVYGMLHLLAMMDTYRLQMVLEVKKLRYGGAAENPGLEREERRRRADELQRRIDRFEESGKSLRKCVHIVLWKGGGSRKADDYEMAATLRHMEGGVENMNLR